MDLHVCNYVFTDSEAYVNKIDMWVLGPALFQKRFIALVDVFNSLAIIGWFIMPVFPFLMLIVVLYPTKRKEGKKINTNALNSNGGMTYADAAKIAMILTVAGFFTVFLPLYDVARITEETVIFCYNLTIYFGGSFFTQFLLLTGLSKYTAQPQTKTKDV